MIRLHYRGQSRLACPKTSVVKSLTVREVAAGLTRTCSGFEGVENLGALLLWSILGSNAKEGYENCIGCWSVLADLYCCALWIAFCKVYESIGTPVLTTIGGLEAGITLIGSTEAATLISPKIGALVGASSSVLWDAAGILRSLTLLVSSLKSTLSSFYSLC